MEARATTLSELGFKPLYAVHLAGAEAIPVNSVSPHRDAIGDSLSGAILRGQELSFGEVTGLIREEFCENLRHGGD